MLLLAFRIFQNNLSMLRLPISHWNFSWCALHRYFHTLRNALLLESREIFSFAVPVELSSIEQVRMPRKAFQVAIQIPLNYTEIQNFKEPRSTWESQATTDAEYNNYYSKNKIYKLYMFQWMIVHMYTHTVDVSKPLSFCYEFPSGWPQRSPGKLQRLQYLRHHKMPDDNVNTE